MTHTVEQFAGDCHRILKADCGPKGQQEVCDLLQEVLKDEEFVATHLGDDVPERKVLYEDAELGFCSAIRTTFNHSPLWHGLTTKQNRRRASSRRVKTL
jgi:hypothetical protein